MAQFLTHTLLLHLFGIIKVGVEGGAVAVAVGGIMITEKLRFCQAAANS